jgi:hypothetical protein
VVAAWVAAVGLSAVLQAAGVPRAPSGAETRPAVAVLRLEDLRRVPRHRFPTIRTYRWAAAAALSVVERDLHFPALRGEIALYSSGKAFEAALLDDGHDPLAVGVSLATVVGVSTPGRIRLNVHRLYPCAWSVRIAAVAHEMTHAAQFQLAGGHRRHTEQWLREGMAEWVGWRVLEALGQGTVADGVRATREALASRRPGPRLPSLADLVSAESWCRLVGEGREDPIYDLSLVAVADLIDRHGLDALMDYFARFALSDDRISHFHACFGEPPAAFEARLGATWQ